MLLLSKKTIANFGYKQWILSIDMKTKVVQHVKSERVFKILKIEMAQVDPRNMLNNFCFHVYAQKSLILPKIAILFFDIIIVSVSTR